MFPIFESASLFLRSQKCPSTFRAFKTSACDFVTYIFPPLIHGKDGEIARWHGEILDFHVYSANADENATQCVNVLNLRPKRDVY